eukprot:Sdes_comp17649_c0_seq1m6918
MKLASIEKKHPRLRFLPSSKVFICFYLIYVSSVIFSLWFSTKIVPNKCFHEEVLPEIQRPYLNLTTYQISLVFLSFFLFCLSVHSHKYPPKLSLYSRNESREISAGFFSRLTFSWFDSMAKRGYESPLVQDDMWKLLRDDQATRACCRFQEIKAQHPDK